MKVSVEQWLAERRRLEPTIEQSVRRWNLDTPIPRVAPLRETKRTKAARRAHKASLYFPDEMLAEIVADADHHDRSLSASVQVAWKIAREKILKYPGAL